MLLPYEYAGSSRCINSDITSLFIFADTGRRKPVITGDSCGGDVVFGEVDG
jgi:hypothetical protein